MKLKAGDIRQEGDECRHKDLSPDGFRCFGLKQSYWDSHEKALNIPPKQPHVPRPGAWTPCVLIGEPILESDLMTADFKRGEKW